MNLLNVGISWQIFDERDDKTTAYKPIDDHLICAATDIPFLNLIAFAFIYEFVHLELEVILVRQTHSVAVISAHIQNLSLIPLYHL